MRHKHINQGVEGSGFNCSILKTNGSFMAPVLNSSNEINLSPFSSNFLKSLFVISSGVATSGGFMMVGVMR